MHAAGSFKLKLTPQTPAGTPARMQIEKQYEGGLDGASTGLMLSAGSPGQGVAGYVAMEEFTGSLEGRRGSFVLQHSGTMNGSRRELVIVVTPGSGTGQLEGISGTMGITVAADGSHSYQLEYSLPGHP